jgi:hypothetical protein
MDTKIRIFIKTYKTGKSFDSFSCVVMGDNGKRGKIFETGLAGTGMSRHRITLEAIRRFIQSIKDTKDHEGYRLIFYADNDEIAYEWNKEHMTDGTFSESTEDLDLYNLIIRQLKRKNLTMEVIGKDSFLSSMRSIV